MHIRKEISIIINPDCCDFLPRVYVVKDKRVVGYDNGEGQGDHRHYEDNIEPYEFMSVWQLTEDFFKDIEKYKRGK